MKVYYTCALYMAYPYSNLFFLHVALKKVIADYDAKQQAGNAMEDTLFTWMDSG